MKYHDVVFGMYLYFVICHLEFVFICVYPCLPCREPKVIVQGPSVVRKLFVSWCLRGKTLRVKNKS